MLAAAAATMNLSMIDRVFARFLLVGVGNTALGLGVIFLARQFTGDVMANLIGYLVVVPVSFLTHRDLSFRDGGHRWAAFARYLPTILAGYAANYAVLTTGLALAFNPYFVQTGAIGCHVVVTYLLSRLFVFHHIEQKIHD
ncbi:MAG: hypothetical protein COW70_10875 [Hydrogenophilales bacterium CG18_big_fil_WC_8_21_14_2_50_58_12]|nr:MAG: hypothetical protein COW70_10875 [Hydrogenophilales bacterium CG18_big_fil_WC_8_21_14_2_50_58_12]